MALTITYKEDEEIVEKCGHGYKLITGSIAFDSSYPTGGEAMDLSKKIPTDLHMVWFEANGGYVFQYDYANKKVKAYYADYSESTDGVLIEVANAVDLSGLTDVRFGAIGK
jgi:hypothetical protein